MTEKLYYAVSQIDDYQFLIACTDRGLAFVDNLVLSKEELQKWFPNYKLIFDLAAIDPYMQALQGFFRGRQVDFNFELDLLGTPFQLAVWQALQTIPYGQTFTYKEIASVIGRPKAVRAVGGAIGRNPVMVIVPCHRVVGSNGKLTGFRGGLELKKKLLEIENIL